MTDRPVQAQNFTIGCPGCPELGSPHPRLDSARSSPYPSSSSARAPLVVMTPSCPGPTDRLTGEVVVGHDQPNGAGPLAALNFPGQCGQTRRACGAQVAVTGGDARFDSEDVPLALARQEPGHAGDVGEDFPDLI